MKEKLQLPVARVIGGGVGEFPSNEESNKELDAIKCLLKQFSISDLSDIRVESTSILGDSSEGYQLKEILWYAKISYGCLSRQWSVIIKTHV